MTRINHRADSLSRRVRVTPYLVSRYMQSDGAIEELNWVPALCHGRQQSTEQTHVTMVFAAARRSAYYTVGINQYFTERLPLESNHDND